MAAEARGSITIIDVSDGKTITAYLALNHPSTQIFNKENSSYTPNYAASGTALTITPEVFVSGTAESAIAQVKTPPVWKVNGSTNLTPWGSVATSAPYTLSINKNLTSVSALLVECELSYTDPDTLLTTKAKASATITKTENAGQLICAVATTPRGNIFKQGITTLSAQCQLWRGSTIDRSQVHYQWHKMRTDGTWEALTSTKSYGTTGYNTETLTVPATAVASYEVFKCDIKDTDSASGTYNTIVSDVVSFVDLTDPYSVQFATPQGDKLIRGVGSLVINAELWQSGRQVLPLPAGVTFAWSKFDKDGRPSNFAGTTSNVKTGQSLTVTSTDVTIKSVFVCTATIP